MNTFLKAALKEAYDVEQIGVAALGKGGLALATLLPLLLVAGEDLPAVVSNAGDAGAEFKALIADPASDADLIAYGVSLGWTSDKKVQAIVARVATLGLHLVEDVSGLLGDLKS